MPAKTVRIYCKEEEELHFFSIPSGTVAINPSQERAVKIPRVGTNRIALLLILAGEKNRSLNI